MSQKPCVTRTWAPKGQTPILRHVGGWKRLTAAAGLTFTQLYFRLYPGSLKAPQLIHFLTHLRRQVGGPLLLVWDHLGVHHSRTVQRWLAHQENTFAQEWLPAYSPELNPVEGVWGWWKKNGVPNGCPATEEQLHWLARRGLRQIQGRRVTLIAAFWKQAELSL